MEQELKRLFEMKEQEISMPVTLPPGSRARIRRQRIVTGGLAAVAAAAIVTGGVAGIGSLTNDAAPISPAGDPAVDPPETTETPASGPGEPDLAELITSNMTTTFVSPRNGYSFKYVDRRGLEPAKKFWDPADQESPVDELGGAGAEYLAQFDTVETGYTAFFMSASTEIPADVSLDEWIDASVSKYVTSGCYVPLDQQESTTIDGQPAKIFDICDHVVATVVMDSRLYLFMLGHRIGVDARGVFDTWMNTVDLTPETARSPGRP